MKNKKTKCIISFLLALVLLVSMPLDITANAFAVETAWVTYALITFLAAMGITFTVSGGIEALENAINEAWDECWGDEADTQRAHLCEIITFRAPTGPPSSGQGPIDPIEAAFMFGSAACALIMKFVEWLKANGWAEREEIASVGTYTYMYNDVPNLGELVQVKDGKYVSGTIFEPHEVENSYDNVFYPYKIPQTNGGYYFWSQKPNKGTIYHTKDTGLDTQQQYSTALGLYYPDGLTLSDFVGIGVGVVTSGVNAGCLIFGLLFNDGTFVLRNILYDVEGVINNISYSIEMPETITEFDVDEDEVVEISFDAFPDDVLYETPEEFAEAVKQQIIDTGTVPQLTPSIETLPAPAPTPIVPIPDTPPELEDIEDLGLPALGEALFNKFPFCIPNDLRNVFLILKAEPETPYWEVNLTGDALGIDSNFVIDFSKYEIVGQMSRWGSVISFCLFLIINTKRMIGW